MSQTLGGAPGCPPEGRPTHLPPCLLPRAVLGFLLHQVHPETERSDEHQGSAVRAHLCETAFSDGPMFGTRLQSVSSLKGRETFPVTGFSFSGERPQLRLSLVRYQAGHSPRSPQPHRTDSRCSQPTVYLCSVTVHTMKLWI